MDETEFGPFEVTVHEAISLVERASERILTLSDLGMKGIEPQDDSRTAETFMECILCHMTARSAKPSLDQLKSLAQKLDRMSIAIPDVGKHGRHLAEEMNLAAARIRSRIMEGTDEKGDPIP